jgi:hypothetical protein
MLTSGIKNREPLPPGGADSRDWFRFHFSFATSQGGVKGTLMTYLVAGILPRAPPTGAMVNDPVRERVLKADITAGFLGFDPFVPQNFLAFRLKFAVKRRVFQEIAGRRC